MLHLSNFMIVWVGVCFCIVMKQFQEYVEPGSDLEAVTQRRNPDQEEESVLLPLGDNTLTHNLGLPIVVVCTKVSTHTHTRWSLAMQRQL